MFIFLGFYFGQQTLLKAARMNIYVRRGGPNYQKGLTKMRALGEEIGVPIQVHATISHIGLFFRPMTSKLFLYHTSHSWLCSCQADSRNRRRQTLIVRI
jgi:hypothetical protein